jgi:hypothetical protein
MFETEFDCLVNRNVFVYIGLVMTGTGWQSFVNDLHQPSRGDCVFFVALIKMCIRRTVVVHRTKKARSSTSSYLSYA